GSLGRSNRLALVPLGRSDRLALGSLDLGDLGSSPRLLLRERFGVGSLACRDLLARSGELRFLGSDQGAELLGLAAEVVGTLGREILVGAQRFGLRLEIG